MARHRDLQPWLDYFDMLRTYEQHGFMLIEAGKHEAYVTEPALYTLAGCSFSARELGMGLDVPHIMTQISHLVRRLRSYAAWKSQGGVGYLSYSFAVNVVKDSGRHHPIYTIVLERKRRWWKLWMRHDSFKVITY